MPSQNILSLCHYYRGEDKCPFDSEKERVQGLFWMFEEMFVRHTLHDPTLLFDFSLFKKNDLFTILLLLVLTLVGLYL